MLDSLSAVVRTPASLRMAAARLGMAAVRPKMAGSGPPKDGNTAARPGIAQQAPCLRWQVHLPGSPNAAWREERDTRASVLGRRR